MRVDRRIFEEETSVLCYGRVTKKRGYVMQDVPRGFTSACRRACLSVTDVGCLFAESPLYHFNAPIGYDNCSIVYTYSIPMRILSMAEFIRACETMDRDGAAGAITDESEFSPRYLTIRARETAKYL